MQIRREQKWGLLGLLIVGLVLVLALLAPWWGGPVHAQEPTATTTNPTMSPTDTPEATEAPTPTASPTETSMPTETATETPTEVPTETPAPTETATPTPTELPTETATEASPPTDTPTTTPTTTPTPYQGPPPPEPVMAPSFMQAAVEWTTPIPVAVTANDSENPVIALDAQGNPHVAWSEKRSDADWDIYYSRWDGISWTGPFAVTATTSRSMRPHLAVDNAGLVHIVWEDDRDGQIKIFYSQGNDTSWSPPVNVSGAVASYPKIGIDSTGKRHVVWDGKAGWDIRYANSTDGVNWPPSQQIPGSSGGYASDMVVDHQGVVHVVWIAMSKIHYAKRVGTGWTTPQVVFTGNCDRPSIAVGSDGQVHVSWLGGPVGGDRNDIYYRRMGGVVENVSNDQKSEWNDIVVDGDNAPRVVWDTQREGPQEIYHAVKEGGVWVLTNVSRQLSADSRWPKAEGKGDAVHVV